MRFDESLRRSAILAVAVVSLVGCETQEARVRILTGGIAHESNTFIPLPSTVTDFTVRRGAAALEKAEWAAFLQESGVEVVPTLHATAPPFGAVERETFDAFKEEILAGARAAGRVDGVYLDMHGALHAEGYEDAQVDFVQLIGHGALGFCPARGPLDTVDLPRLVCAPERLT